MAGFRWDEIESYIPLTRSDRQMLHIGREYGLADGYTVPRHLPGEASGACSFVLRPQSELQDDMLRIAEIIGALATVSARQLVGAVPLKSKATLSEQIGRAQDRTPVTHAQLVCRHLLETKKNKK